MDSCQIPQTRLHIGDLHEVREAELGIVLGSNLYTPLERLIPQEAEYSCRIFQQALTTLSLSLFMQQKKHRPPKRTSVVERGAKDDQSLLYKISMLLDSKVSDTRHFELMGCMLLGIRK